MNNKIISNGPIIGRRNFIKGAGKFAALAGFVAAQGVGLNYNRMAWGADEGAIFITRLEHNGDWDTDMKQFGTATGAEINLLKHVKKHTVMNPNIIENHLPPSSPDLFKFPFLYLTAHSEFGLTEADVRNLREHIQLGGFLLMEDCRGDKNRGFDISARRELKRIAPGEPLINVPLSHPIFRCAYHFNHIPGGDKQKKVMHGIEIDGRLSIVYTQNDYGCAWEGHPCRPGGARQRQDAYQMGVNFLTYAMT